jgi:hypothetical protein
MFARTVKIVVAAITLFAGSACKHGIDNCDCGPPDTYSVLARGANVVPSAADTAPRATATFNTASLAYIYNVTTQPTGTIDSIALYQVAQGDPLPSSATAILCVGVAACAATSGTAKVVAPATNLTIKNSMRAYGTQLVFFTTTCQMAAGGAMRGTMYPNPYP